MSNTPITFTPSTSRGSEATNLYPPLIIDSSFSEDQELLNSIKVQFRKCVCTIFIPQNQGARSIKRKGYDRSFTLLTKDGSTPIDQLSPALQSTTNQFLAQHKNYDLILTKNENGPVLILREKTKRARLFPHLCDLNLRSLIIGGILGGYLGGWRGALTEASRGGFDVGTLSVLALTCADIWDRLYPPQII